jgi:hypothetical protein
MDEMELIRWRKSGTMRNAVRFDDGEMPRGASLGEIRE